MTERLYYTDSYQREFRARVAERSPDGQTVYLDRTLFYPTSGGQPFDLGSIDGVAVVDVVDEEDRIAHRLAAPLTTGGEVAAEIDWTRRFDHMQQHSGQHLLSAVFEELFNLHTVSFHLGAESATIDLEGGPVEPRTVLEAERRANQLVAENRALDVRFEDAGAVQGLRKPSGRQGMLRIVSIDGLDRSACGGTHVRTTGEIGPILLRRTEKIRQSVRVEFVCGGRAVRRARQDFEALQQHCAARFRPAGRSGPAGGRSIGSGESRREDAPEVGTRPGRLSGQGALCRHRTRPGRHPARRAAAGPRQPGRPARRGAEFHRAIRKGIFVATLKDPPSVLLAASADSGIDAGKVLKAALTAAGGRGGGNARIAQGSVPECGIAGHPGVAARRMSTARLTLLPPRRSSIAMASARR